MRTSQYTIFGNTIGISRIVAYIRQVNNTGADAREVSASEAAGWRGEGQRGLSDPAALAGPVESVVAVDDASVWAGAEGGAAGWDE